MPLIYADGSIDSITLQTVPEHFVIFYSSNVNNELWCPDCRAVEDLVKQTFPEGGPEGLIVYVGDRSQWKQSSNVYRQAPWNLKEIPTIVRTVDGKERGRLEGDAEITKRLANFVKEDE